MTVQTATFAFYRNGELKACVGSELQDKLVDGDLLAMMRADQNYKLGYDGQDSIENTLLDTDVLVCTDTDGVTYACTGEKFKTLFTWTKIFDVKAKLHVIVKYGSMRVAGRDEDKRITDMSGNVIDTLREGETYIDTVITTPGEYLIESSSLNFSSILNGNQALEFDIGPQTDTLAVTNMNAMFYQCRSASPNGLQYIKTDNCTRLTSAFGNMDVFNGTGMGEWNVEKVTDFENCFHTDKLFNRGEIAKWRTPEAVNMKGMFYYCNIFNQDISSWCVPKISSKPTYFDSHTTSAWTTAMKPQWGTCPTPPFSPDLEDNQGVFYITNITGGDININNTYDPLVTVYLTDGTVANVTTLPANSGDWIVVCNTGMALFRNSTADWEFTHKTDTSRITSMRSMFLDCNKFTGKGVEYIDTSSVRSGYYDSSNNTGLAAVFSGCSEFNGDVTQWDVSNNHYFLNMFKDCVKFNRDLSSWKVDGQTLYMFYGCSTFNSPVGANWKIVEAASYMFYGAVKFNQDISGWHTRDASAMHSMLEWTPAFNQDISNWCTERFLQKPDKFDLNGHPDFQNNDAKQPEWGTCAIVPPFNSIAQLHIILISGSLKLTSASQEAEHHWNSKILEDMNGNLILDYKDFGAAVLSTPGEYLIKSNDDNFRGLLQDSTGVFEIGNQTNTTVVRNFSYAFDKCSEFTGTGLEYVDTSNAVDMSFCLRKVPKLNTTELGSWNMSKAKDLTGMFVQADEFNDPGITTWDTSSVINMEEMFRDCHAFEQDLSGWCVTNITSKPHNFDYRTLPRWTTAMKPQWGTCP